MNTYRKGARIKLSSFIAINKKVGKALNAATSMLTPYGYCIKSIEYDLLLKRNNAGVPFVCLNDSQEESSYVAHLVVSMNND